MRSTQDVVVVHTYFWQTYRSSCFGSRRLVHYALIPFEQVILHGFYQEIFALRIVFHQRFFLHSLNKKFLTTKQSTGSYRLPKTRCILSILDSVRT